MKAKAVVVSGLLLSAFGLGLIVYGNLPAFGSALENIMPQTAQVSVLYPEQKLFITEKPYGEGTFIVELTTPAQSKVASIQQEKVTAQLTSMGATIQRRYSTTVNAITINIDRQKIYQVAAMPDVKRIYEDKPIARIPDVDNTNYYSVTVQSIAEGLHDEGYTGKGVMIFVIDTGINASLPQLQRNGESVVKVSYSTYDANFTHWHGSFIACEIASQYPDMIGIAPGADLGSICVFDYNGEAWISDILEATDFVARWHRMHPTTFCVVSCSFGVSQHSWHCGGWSDPCIICEAFNSLAGMGMPVVVAAGNDGPENDINCPGQAQHVLTVGAVDFNKEIAWFSSRGPTTDGNRKPDVVSYGVNIKSVDSHGNVKIASGTSFSTPLVAGVIADMGEKYGYSYSPEQYYNAIRQSAEDLGEYGWDVEYGYGFVNAASAFNAMGVMTPAKTYYQVGVPIFCLGVVMTTAPLWRRRI